MDIVSKRQYKVIIGVIILQSYLRKGVSLHAVYIDDLFGQRLNTSCLVNMLYKLSDTALIVESFTYRVILITLVLKDYLYTRIQECLLSESFKKDLIIKLCGLKKYLGIGLKEN